MKRVFVCCPGNSVTGGPELLHQFVHQLRENNVDARIVYYPFDGSFRVPDIYIDYDVIIDKASSVSSDDIVVVPEVKTGLLTQFSCHAKFIWWLSVDNYFNFTGKSPLKEKVIYYIRCIKGSQLSFPKMKKLGIKHLTQSQYAKDYLKDKNINSKMLTDYLNEIHLNSSYLAESKEDFIIYNPKKGILITMFLIKAFPNFKFIPIQNMTPIEVKALLMKGKVYIDFGLHPGKDRFPREAAMAGCCIITGRCGSAFNSEDVYIPDEYKLSSKGNELIYQFNELIQSIFKDYSNILKKFRPYRERIKLEKKIFEEQVKMFIQSDLL